MDKNISILTREEYQTTIIPTQGHRSLGGSHVAGLMTKETKYNSPYKVYKELIEGRNEQEFSKYAQAGINLEPYVVDEFLKLHPEYEVVEGFTNKLIINNKLPGLIAACDRILKNKETGELIVLEIKTTSEMASSKWDDNNIPDEYFWQCIHYMWLTGVTKVILFAAIGFTEVIEHTIEYEDVIEYIAMLSETVTNFMNYNIKQRIEPDVDAKECTKETLDQQAKTRSIETLDPSIDRLFDRLEELKEHEKNIKEEIDLAKNKIRYSLKGFGKAETERYRITYKEQSSVSFDSKTFKEEHPELYQQYRKTNTYTKLDIRRKK